MPRGSSSLVKNPMRRSAAVTTNSTVVNQWLSKTSTRSGFKTSKTSVRSASRPVKSVLSFPLFSSRRSSSGSTMVGTCARSPAPTISPMGGPFFDLERLQIRIEIERVVAALAADAADAGAAEGCGEVAHQEAVDPDGAGAQQRPHPLGARLVRGVEDRREPVGRGVGEFGGLRLVAETLDRQHRTEDLSLDDLGVVGLGLDERRLVPEAVLGERLTPEDDSVAVSPCSLDEPVDTCQVIGVDQGRDRGLGLSTVTEHVAPRRDFEARDEVLTDRRVHEQSRARQAHLAAVVEHHGGLLGGGGEIGVGEDEERALAPEFGGEGYEILRGGFTDEATGLGRAGEGDPTDPRVIHERSSDLVAQSLDDVEDTVRKAGLVDEVHQHRTAQR